MDKKIILVAFTFSVLLVILNNQNVYALNELQFTKTAVATQDFNSMFYQKNNDGNRYLWAVGGTGASQILNKYSAINGTLLNSYDFDVAIGFSTYDNTDIWCSATNCYVTTGKNVSSCLDTGAMWKISTSGTLVASFNSPAGYNKFTNIFGRDAFNDGTTVLVFGSVRSNAGCVSFPDDGTSTQEIVQTNGDFLLTREFDDMASSSRVRDIKWSGVGGPTNNYILVSNANTLYIYDLSNAGTAPLCSVAVTNAGMIVPNYTVSSPRAYIASNTLLKAFDTCTANASSDITSTLTGLTGNIRNGLIIPDRNIFIIQEQGSNAIISVVPFDETTNTASSGFVTYETFPATAQNTITGADMYSDTVDKKIFTVFHNTDRKILIGTFVTGATGGFTCNIDTNSDGIADYIFTDTNGDGLCDVPSNVSTLIFAGQTGANVTQSAGTIGCGIGLSSCTNLDVKTNGMGLILMLILLAGFSVLVMWGARTTNTSLNEVHPVFWFLLVLGVTGASWQLNWTDAIPFFSSIVAIVGLGSAKIVSHLRGGG